MSRKAFHVGIDLDIHAVTCPGVWLCPRGGAMLRISMLGSSIHTKRVEPSFPLLFHECFHFRKTFTGVTSLTGLQAELSKRLVHIQLVQWQVHGCRCVLLAAFCSPLSDLLYPQPAVRGRMAGVDVDLLMETTSCFPGIIAPKMEVSTKVVIEEMVNFPIHNHDSVTVNHKTITSKKQNYKKELKPDRLVKVKGKFKGTGSCGPRSRMRQKPVCHTRPRVKCNSCKQKVDWTQTGQGRKVREKELDFGREDCYEPDETLLPYCNKCGDVVQENQVKQGKVILKDNIQHIGQWETACPCDEPQMPKSVCDCNLCRRYNSYFRKPTICPVESDCSANYFTKSSNLRFERSLSPLKKDKCFCCQCTDNAAEEKVPRQRAGTCCTTKAGCPCLHISSGTDSVDNNGDTASEQKRQTKSDDYQHLFKADLDNHYKRLYERVSRRNNRRES